MKSKSTKKVMLANHYPSSKKEVVGKKGAKTMKALYKIPAKKK